MPSYRTLAIVACAVPTPSLAQSVAGNPPTPPPGAVLYDASQGPALWARGATYKAGFDATGAQFVPFLGSKAPRNFPIALALVEARAGGEALALASGVPPRRDGQAIVYERGSIVEVYELGPDALEQLFLVPAPPRDAELVLRVRCTTELAPFAEAGGIRFHGEHGGAHYGKATVFDAHGRSTDAPVSWARERSRSASDRTSSPAPRPRSRSIR